MVETTTERVHDESIVIEGRGEIGEPHSRVLAWQPDPRTADWLWKWLVVGLLVILGIAVIGLIVAAERDAPRTDDLIAPVTAILSGLLGLFVHPPFHHGRRDTE